MPRLPGFCESCGAVFASPLRARRPGSENAFDVPAPCPACGGTGRVPGELLTLAAEAAELFAGPEPTEREAAAFLALLETDAGIRTAPGAGRDGEAAGTLATEAARRAPAFVELARRVADAPPPVRRGVAALLRRVEEAMSRGEEAGAAVERAARSLLEEEAVERPEEEGPGDAARARLDAAGRNDPCPCGSGRKYKDCHWVRDLRKTRDRG